MAVVLDGRFPGASADDLPAMPPSVAADVAGDGKRMRQACVICFTDVESPSEAYRCPRACAGIFHEKCHERVDRDKARGGRDVPHVPVRNRGAEDQARGRESAQEAFLEPRHPPVDRSESTHAFCVLSAVRPSCAALRVGRVARQQPAATPEPSRRNPQPFWIWMRRIARPASRCRMRPVSFTVGCRVSALQIEGSHRNAGGRCGVPRMRLSCRLPLTTVDAVVLVSCLVLSLSRMRFDALTNEFCRPLLL